MRFDRVVDLEDHLARRFPATVFGCSVRDEVTPDVSMEVVKLSDEDHGQTFAFRSLTEPRPGPWAAGTWADVLAFRRKILGED